MTTGFPSAIPPAALSTALGIDARRGTTSPDRADLFSIGTRRANRGVDLAQMLTTGDPAEASLSPEDRFAQARDSMIGTILDLTR